VELRHLEESDGFRLVRCSLELALMPSRGTVPRRIELDDNSDEEALEDGLLDGSGIFDGLSRMNVRHRRRIRSD
jgi:hypothetical protein